MKLRSLLISLLIVNVIYSQNKVVVPVYAGPNSSVGFLYSVDTTGTQNVHIHDFTKAADIGTNKSNKMIRHSNGMFYGVTAKTLEHPGCFFEFNPNNYSFRSIRNFDFKANFEDPNGQLYEASNGHVYGTIPNNYNFGGAAGIFEYDPTNDSLGVFFSFGVQNLSYGTINSSSRIDTNFTYLVYDHSSIYKLDHHSGSLSLVHFFSAEEGTPTSGLSFSNGKFYGVLDANVAGGCGSIYSIDPSNDQFQIEASGAASGMVFGSFTPAPSGILYGIGFTALNDPFIFKYDPATDSVSRLFMFDDYLVKSYPSHGALYVIGNKLYGLANEQNSNLLDYDIPYVFSYDLNTNVFTKEHYIDVAVAGQTIRASVASGNDIIVSSSDYGANGAGSLYKYNVVSHAVTVIEDFGPLHEYPTSMIINSAGKLVTTNENGGSYYYGELYQYDLTSNTYSEIYPFTADSTFGANPTGFLCELQPGTYLCNTNYGIQYQSGTLVILNPASGSNKIVYPHQQTNVTDPAGELVESNGYLYGLSVLGQIYRINMQTRFYEGLATVPDGSQPKGGLTMAANGRFYGTCSTGGTGTSGTLFEFDPATHTVVTKIHFSSVLHGKNPCGTMILAPDNKLYGVATLGGNFGGGTMFSYNPANNTITKLTNLGTGTIVGKWPEEGLRQMNATDLIGTMSAGGTNSKGSLFKYNYVTNTFTELVHFTTTSGINPESSPLEYNGKVYGLTYGSGVSSRTCIFEFDLSTGILRPVYKFQYYENGSYPKGVHLHNGKYYTFIATDNIIQENALWEHDPLSNTGQKIRLWTSPLMGTGNMRVTEATNGFWYISCSSGGANNLGTIVKLDPNTFTATKLLDRDSIISENTGKLQEYNGSLYNYSVRYGSPNTNGYIYKFDLSTNTYSVIQDFNSVGSLYSPTSMVVDQNGFAYCYSNYGGVNQPSTIKKVNLNTGAIVGSSTLPVNSGYNPNNNLVLASNGFLYASTLSGGMNGSGAFVKIDTGTLTGTIIHSITSGSRFRNAQRLFKLDQNNIIGIVSNDVNTTAYLTVFKINTQTNQFTILSDFGMNDGSGSHFDIVTCHDTTLVNISTSQTLACEGSTVNLMASSNNSNITQKQWFFRNTAIAGANTDNLQILNFSSSDTGAYYCQYSTVCGPVKSNIITVNTINCDSVYPGDANRDGITDNTDFLNIAVAAAATGSPRTLQDNLWYAHYASQWPYAFQDNVNYKHADCNGDGIIDLNDTSAVIQNMTNTHMVPSFYSVGDEPERSIVYPALQVVASANYLLPNQQAYLDLFLVNDSLNPLPLYGLALDVSFDNNLLQPLFNNFTFQNNFLYNNSSEGFDYARITPGLLETAETRFNRGDTLGGGFLGRFNFRTTGTGTGTADIGFNINTVKLINKYGCEIPMGLIPFNPVFVDFALGLNGQAEKGIRVENHSSDGFYIIRMQQHKVYSAIMYNTFGEKVKNTEAFTDLLRVNTADLATGMYFLELSSVNERIVEKIVINR
ncbi:MAG: C-terminal target protein [Bacteroidota bacterium]|jgi:uncharacterized repeat protein (TIGR03803 family)|nr:C-terminal target protein [Bacteroidota bacterium]